MACSACNQDNKPIKVTREEPKKIQVRPVRLRATHTPTQSQPVFKPQSIPVRKKVPKVCTACGSRLIAVLSSKGNRKQCTKCGTAFLL